MQLRSWKIFVVLITVLLMGALVGTNGYGMEIPKADWKVIYVSSEEKVAEDGRGVLAIDGKPETFWHSQWKDSVPKHPHEIHIDMGKSYELVGFKYLPRQGSTHGRIKKYEFYISNSSTAWGTAIKIGEFDSTDIEKVVAFPAVAGRYIRMVALSEINAQAYASLAELSVLVADDFVFPQGALKVTFTPSTDTRATGHNLYVKNLVTSTEVKIDVQKATEKLFASGYFLPDTRYEITATAYGKVDNKNAESIRSNALRVKVTASEIPIELKAPVLSNIEKVE
jgi:hypothetical protein